MERPPSHEPLRFHQRLPGYAPTPLVSCPGIAEALGVGRVLVKDESSRLGLPSFKILGASWAIYRSLLERLGVELPEWSTFEELATLLEPIKPLSLVAATDGNHGRAVARMAHLLGLGAHIFVPKGMSAPRLEGIESEGARVSVVDGDYDDAIRRSAEEASDRCLVISDTSWPGYERVPRWIIDGYATIFWEVDAELPDGPDLVAAQMGVGAFAGSVVNWCRSPEAARHPQIVGVEPIGADCVLASARVGEVTTTPGPHGSIMVGLNCGTPSLVAWPSLVGGIDWFLAIEDDRAREAMRLLAADGVVSGESGAAGLGGLLEAFDGDSSIKSAVGTGPDATVLVVSTEGATDPHAYREIVGESATEVAARSGRR